jgi:hypothetical protein
VLEGLFEQSPVAAVAGLLKILEGPRAGQLQTRPLGLTFTLLRSPLRPECLRIGARIRDLIFDGLALPTAGHKALYSAAERGLDAGAPERELES